VWRQASTHQLLPITTYRHRPIVRHYVFLSIGHFLGTAVALTAFFTAGQQAVLMNLDASFWLDVLGAIAVAFSLPLVYPLMYFDVLSPAAPLSFFLVAIAVNSALVTYVALAAVRAIRSCLRGRRSRHDEF